MKKQLLFFLLFLSNLAFPQEALFEKILRAQDSVSIENLNTHIQKLEYAGGHYSRVNLTPGNDSAVVYIYNELKKFPHLKVELDTFFISSAASPYNEKPQFNVIATLEGSKYPNQYYIIGAHLDCSASRMENNIWDNQWKTIKAPGADDNATGIAALLEIARILSDSSIGLFNDYSIRFIAFGAEESGPSYRGSHHGSRHYAEAASKRGESIPGMVSVDMIGYNPLYDYTAIVSNAASQWLAQKFYAANDIFSVGLITNTPPFPYATYSDHDSFWRYNYSAILLIENAPPWNDSLYYDANEYYHKSSDASSTVNLGLVKKVTQLTLSAVSSLSAKFTEVDLDEERDLEFIIVQNYPNPFNPSTRIEYTIPEAAQVNIGIFSILGQKVTELENAYKLQGTYSLLFDADDLPSGIYFYEVTANSEGKINRTVRKMNLLK